MATKNLSAPMSGAIHVRTRLTEDFTILANRLAQRPGSAVTVGVGLFITSAPDGTPITIEALQKHFNEGETVLSRALRELEAEGWLERRLIRLPNGRVVTRTYVYSLPERSHERTEPAPEPSEPEPAPEPSPAPVSAPAPQTAEAPAPRTGTNDDPITTSPTPVPETPTPPSSATAEAVEILTGLSRVDPRLLLTRKEIARLAPGVDAWLASGVLPSRITGALTTDLPATIRSRPSHLLAWRLDELQPSPSAVPISSPPPTAAALPLQNCSACDHGFRATVPGLCPFCKHCPDERTSPEPVPAPSSAAGQRVAQRLAARTAAPSSATSTHGQVNPGIAP